MALLALTLVGVGVAAAIGIYAGMTRQRALMRYVVLGAFGWLAVYFCLLLIVSIKSPQKVLGLNEEKRFCGFYLDCHLSASVVNVFKTKSLGKPGEQKTANGTFYIVTVKISSDAKSATLQLADPVAKVVDEQGREYERALAAEAALEDAAGKAVALVQAVGPSGDFYMKDLVFDLPANVENPALTLTDAPWPDRLFELFIIGDEDSLFHRKSRFRLEPQA
jgi:hypothetical protein